MGAEQGGTGLEPFPALQESLGAPSIFSLHALYFRVSYFAVPTIVETETGPPIVPCFTSTFAKCSISQTVPQNWGPVSGGYHVALNFCGF